MKKMRCQSLEHLVGTIPEDELVRFAFQKIDEACDSVNEILNQKSDGASVGYIETLILNDKEYPRPKE